MRVTVRSDDLGVMICSAAMCGWADHRTYSVVVCISPHQTEYPTENKYCMYVGRAAGRTACCPWEICSGTQVFPRVSMCIHSSTRDLLPSSTRRRQDTHTHLPPHLLCSLRQTLTTAKRTISFLRLRRKNSESKENRSGQPKQRRVIPDTIPALYASFPAPSSLSHAAPNTDPSVRFFIAVSFLCPATT